MFKKIDHVEIIPADLERTLRFYTEILGFKIKTRQKVEAGPFLTFQIINPTFSSIAVNPLKYSFCFFYKNQISESCSIYHTAFTDKRFSSLKYISPLLF